MADPTDNDPLDGSAITNLTIDEGAIANVPAQIQYFPPLAALLVINQVAAPNWASLDFHGTGFG